jgi:hypothetical protein
MSLPGDENPNPQWQRPQEPPRWTQGSPLGDQEQQPQWQEQQYPQWQPPPRTPGQAFAALILGIVGLFPICPIILSVLAIIFGFMAKNEIERSGGTLGGAGIAMAGLILGWVGLALYVLFFAAILAV